MNNLDIQTTVDSTRVQTSTTAQEFEELVAPSILKSALQAHGRQEVRFIIGIEKQEVRANHTSNSYFVHKTSIEVTEQFKVSELPQAQVDSVSHPNLEIIIAHANGSRLCVDLPEGMRTRLASYLLDNSEYQNFDCEAFIYFINGIPRSPYFDEHCWKIERDIKEEELAPGDTIILCKQRRSFILDDLDLGACPELYNRKHWALYLGAGLYLSKFGSISALVATDLSSMQSNYEADIILRATCL